MTDIVAANVTYSFKSKDKMFEGRRGFSARGTISFGNGTLTYPTGGVPLTKAKIGLPRVLRSVDIIEQNAKGYLMEYDVSAETIRMFQAAAETVTAANATTTGNASAPTITLVANSGNPAADLVVGVNALANASFLESSHTANIVGITGVQAPTLTMDAHTHTLTGTAARLGELSGGSTAVQAVVLEVICEGY